MKYFGCALAVSTLLASFASVQPACAADPRELGPLSLVITYHATPANRLPLLKELAQSELRQLEHWKEAGILKRYSLLTNRYADSGTWDATAILTFPNEAAFAGWKKIEQSFPAGLTPKALALTSAIETTPVDLMRDGHAPAGVEDPVFLVIPYEYSVSEGEYLKYLDGYTIPQLEGWIGEGILSSYEIYLGRYPAGRPWSAMLVLEYKSDAGLAQREAVVAKVRARLAANPEWKAISDDKKNIRTEKELVVADPVAGANAK